MQIEDSEQELGEVVYHDSQTQDDGERDDDDDDEEVRTLLDNISLQEGSD